MPKRNYNVREEEFTNGNSSSDEYETESDENDDEYVPFKRQKVNDDIDKCRNRFTNDVISTKGILEEYEHTYSCEPRFTYIDGKRVIVGKGKGQYFGEMTENSSRSVRRSHLQSTSSESSGKKSPPYEHIQNVPKRKPTVFSKTAVQARLNRQKKKEYVSSLESDIRFLRDENKMLETKLNTQDNLVVSLKKEIKYLRSVIVNSNELGVLLKKICGESSGLKIKSSVMKSPMLSQENNITNEDTDGLDLPASPIFDWSDLDKPVSDAPSSEFEEIDEMLDPLPGVCLHVANKQVSIEFCASCNRNATSSDVMK